MSSSLSPFITLSIAFILQHLESNCFMNCEIVCLKAIVTLVAFLWNSLLCFFQTFSQSACPRGSKVTLFAFCLFFLHRALSNVSSKHLPQRIQSYTICIYLIFLHCVPSNVSWRICSHAGDWLHLFGFPLL